MSYRNQLLQKCNRIKDIADIFPLELLRVPIKLTQVGTVIKKVNLRSSIIPNLILVGLRVGSKDENRDCVS